MKADLEKKLTAAATKAMANAHSPYSHLKVGAALLMGDGEIFSGCNIENTVFPATLCAERAAISSAVTQGSKVIDAVVVVSTAKEPLFPCGICLQTITEFASGPSLEVISVGANGRRVRNTLGRLLPTGISVRKVIKTVEG